MASTMNTNWPKSQTSLPPPPSTLTLNRKLEFPFGGRAECTSLTLPPSGRHIVAGFNDGTLRIFDIVGRFLSPSGSSITTSSIRNDSEEEEEFEFDVNKDQDDDDSSSTTSRTSSVSDDESPTEDIETEIIQLLQKQKQSESDSKLPEHHHRRHRRRTSKSSSDGTVAAQIHARGVITSLLMDVAVSQDNRFAFGGVLRGSVEMVAVDLSKVEAYHDEMDRREDYGKSSHGLLDLIRVFQFSDAKLRGFGACTRVRSGTEEARYLLFCGKGIKVH